MKERNIPINPNKMQFTSFFIMNILLTFNDNYKFCLRNAI